MDDLEHEPQPGFNTVEEAIEALRNGEIIIIVDAKDRENEGDLVCAADKCTPDVINFMVKHGRGQVCMPILPELAERLKLHPMVLDNTARLQTAFTVSVDHVSCKTGISAFERARTVQAIIDPRTRPEDLARPGHMHPLIAKEGGVLRRAGHTEAGVDMARLAGFKPAAVLCEILDDDGQMASRERLLELARRFNLKIITIASLIRYRRLHERLVERAFDQPVRIPTTYGDLDVLVYNVKFESQQPLALIKGEPDRAPAPLVRMHSSCFTGDLIESLRCDCGGQLKLALRSIEQEGCGVLVYLPQEGRGIGLVDKLKAYRLQDQGLDTVEANIALGHKADLRDYGIGVQILKDLGLTKIRLLTNNPKKTEAINFLYRSFDLQVVEQIPIVATPTPHNINYLKVKRDKLGHTLPQELDSACSATEKPVARKQS
ncbi:MAG: GTP cyclohydrolase II [Candidatus Sumerlaeia bacterium]